MTPHEFKATLTHATPPEASPLLRALWHDANGDWDAAHRITQDIESIEAAWVHAYLHRKEGDLGNAGYWYGRARKPMASNSLAAEWDGIVSTLLRVEMSDGSGS